MTNSEEKKLSGGAITKSIFDFLLNFFLTTAVFALLIFLQHGDSYPRYVADNLPLLSFCACCIFLLFWVVYFYYVFENKTLLVERKNVWLIFLLMDVCLLLFRATDYLHVYARPVALFALLVLFLVGYRDAIFLNMVFSVVSLLMDVFINYSQFLALGVENQLFSSFMICFIGGMFAIFFGKGVRTRAASLWITPIIILPTAFIIAMLDIADFENLASAQVLKNIGFGSLGCLFSTAGLLLLLPVFEVVFRSLTVFRLQEMTSPDAKLLKRLKKEAFGTFNHSMVVAQLAESCAVALGENAALARAAAYYHDVGKIHQPEFFTENQTEYNLHDELTPELSADIIRSHTTDGYELLKNYGLPKFFADVALQHHGTMPITYFYTKALRMSDGEINIEDYSYAGPKPKSRIAAIVMIADACEAATRSLKDRTAENVERVVRNIIQQRMDLEQFTDCNITMGDLQLMKETLVASLTGVYHHRIKYPDVQFTRTGVQDKGGSVHDGRS